MHSFPVTDLSDPRVSPYRDVPDPELLQSRGCFVAEGRLVVRRLLTESLYTTESVMVTDAARAALADVLEMRPEVPIYVVPPLLMNGIMGFNIHRGCLAIGQRMPPTPWRDVIAHARLIVALERVGNPDNVGGIFRNAAAFGVGAVLLDEATSDPLYRKSIRTSMGASLVMPFARVGSLPDMLSEVRRDEFATVAMTPAPSAAPLASIASAARSRSVVLVLGHEGEGLSEHTLRACEFQARIPISSAVDSLNVASAAAIGLHEFTRGVPER